MFTVTQIIEIGLICASWGLGCICFAADNMKVMGLFAIPGIIGGSMFIAPLVGA